MSAWPMHRRASQRTDDSIVAKAAGIVAFSWKRDRHTWGIGVVVVAILGITILLAWMNWQGLVEWSGMRNGEVLQNVSLTCAAGSAFILAFWRSALVSRQTAQGDHSLQNERYQKGADMLGSGTLASRLGGIYALERLAREHPREYYKQARDLLCAFVRHPSPDIELTPESSEDRRCRDDVLAALQAIVTERDSKSDQRHGFKPELNYSDIQGGVLSGSDLSSAQLISADISFSALYSVNLSGSSLINANLSYANLLDVDLSGAHMYDCNLSDANLYGVDLSDANLDSANLTRTHMGDVKGLTQRQLDSASRKSTVEPPRLDGAQCAKTGEPLIWKDTEEGN